MGQRIATRTHVTHPKLWPIDQLPALADGRNDRVRVRTSMLHGNAIAYTIPRNSTHKQLHAVLTSSQRV